jgi:hypothetical protein
VAEAKERLKREIRLLEPQFVQPSGEITGKNFDGYLASVQQVNIIGLCGASRTWFWVFLEGLKS